MGQIPGQVAQAVGPIARQTGRFLYSPSGQQSAENRVIPAGEDYPIQDFGYKSPTPQPPPRWYKDASLQERNRKSSGL